MTNKNSLEQDSLIFHARGRPGKIEIIPSKPLTTQEDLSLAYSPGVAGPCREIHKDPDKVYDYTIRGNLVAVISNGTAVLGLGAIGALASKPVMEGKAVLFKRYADVDAVDLEVDTTDVDRFVDCVSLLGPSFGGINLEDIRAPECFIIEQRLREMMDIPVFHDDQHGTAIISAAGLLNAAELTGRQLSDITLVINGAGAAGIACCELVKALGVPHNQVILCDTKGVIYQGREEGMNQWKSAHAVPTPARSLAEALVGADAFFGLSSKGAVTKAMVASMAKQPIIFAMANPDPEITPDEVREVRDDAIIATGRSDYANQVNNVLGYPYIFRGALDVRARTINEDMKLAAAKSIAALARSEVPDEVAAAYGGRELHYGPEYIIPTPFDPRLIVEVPLAVAEAAMNSGVARKPISDWAAYRQQLRGRLDPTVSVVNLIMERVRQNNARVVFAEGENEKVMRAAMLFHNAGYGKAILVGRSEEIRRRAREMGLHGIEDLEIHNASLSQKNHDYTEFIYQRWQRKGMIYRDCQRLINQDRNVFAASMVANGEADALVSGVTRSFAVTYEGVTRAIGVLDGYVPMAMAGLVVKDRTIFLADVSVNEQPDGDTLAKIARQSAQAVRGLGLEPRVAFLAFNSFGARTNPETNEINKALTILDKESVDFEYEGEMAGNMALNYKLQKELYPFSRLSGPANILILPNLHAAHICTRIMPELGNVSPLGPLMIGFSHAVQIVTMGANVRTILNSAIMAAHDAIRNRE